ASSVAGADSAHGLLPEGGEGAVRSRTGFFGFLSSLRRAGVTDRELANVRGFEAHRSPTVARPRTGAIELRGGRIGKQVKSGAVLPRKMVFQAYRVKRGGRRKK